MNNCMKQEDAMNMSNEQAINILIPLRNMMRDQYGCPISDAYFALDKAIEVLKQTESHWIPCSERLPEYSGTYLVTLVDEDGQTWGDTCEWDSTFGGRWLAVFDSEYRDVSNVVAWMPLLEPYAERRTDEN